MELLTERPAEWLSPMSCGGRETLWSAHRVLASVVLLSGLLSPVSVPADSGFRLAGANYLGDLPTLVADQRGLFGEEGIAVSVDYGYSGKENLERLRSGETAFALMGLAPLVIDQMNDPTPGGHDDPVILANLVHADNLNQLVALRGAGLRSPADLRGRTIGVTKGTTAEFFWWQLMTYHGIEVADVSIVDYPIGELAGALLDKAIDAALMWEPWTSRLQAELGEELQIFDTSKVYTAKWVFVTRRRMITEHPQEVQALLRAYRRAVEFIGRQSGAAMQMYSEHADVSVDVLRRRWSNLDYHVSLDWSLIVALQQKFEWLRHAGYADDEQGSSVLALIESGPLQAVAPTAISIPGLGIADRE